MIETHNLSKGELCALVACLEASVDQLKGSNARLRAEVKTYRDWNEHTRQYGWCAALNEAWSDRFSNVANAVDANNDLKEPTDAI